MPNKAVEFQDEALLDYRASLKWYLERSPGTASRFAEEIEHVIAAIAENPGAGLSVLMTREEFYFRTFRSQ